MRIFATALITCLLPLTAFCQGIKGYYYNEEYQVYLHINTIDNDVTVPEQEIYGQLPGYFGSKRDSRLWLVLEAKPSGKKTEITVINDYGSEDFTATLSENSDGLLTMKHEHGSTYKIVVNGKYVKIPKTLVLKKQ